MNTRVGDLANHFQSATSQSASPLAVAFAIGIPALAIGLGFLAYHKFCRAEREYNAPNKLFDGLCRVHRLARRDRRLLLQIAAELKVEQAALLFTNPALLRTASRKQIAAPSKRIKLLHRTLFD
ncbi:hypothetical protein EC9_49200 [Rosistilla ulvae]|uniref:Uncharacterized protein n=1 Tax=Rosistilla ulvae TaxID=1930277 RepID=A0A517M740_9BACT|nr:hypothetical protein [Rosistilla ulvae]QDS90704.1 hypothetical protein EC9_49200 [Rosistilla ulvae]